MALEAREISAMRNFAAVGQIDQAVVSEFVALASKAPESKQLKIAETLAARVRSGETMQHGGKTLTSATMATIAIALGSSR
jgi:hypothetical protein